MAQKQCSHDEARAIATITFLLKDDKSRGDRLEHSWNVHLSSAPRGNTQNLLHMFMGPISDTDEAQAAADSESAQEQQEDLEGEELHHAAASPVPASAARRPSAHASTGHAAAAQLSRNPPAGVLVSASPQHSMASPPKTKGGLPCAAGLQQQATKQPDAACAEMLAALPTTRLRDEQHSNSSSTFATSSPAGNSVNIVPATQQATQQQQQSSATSAAAQNSTDPATVPVLPAPSASCADPTVASCVLAPHNQPGVQAAIAADAWQLYEDEEDPTTPTSDARSADKALFLLWDVQACCKLLPPCNPAALRPVSLPPGAKPYVSLDNTLSRSHSTRHSRQAGAMSTAAVTPPPTAAPAVAPAPVDALDQLMAAMPAAKDSSASKAAVPADAAPVPARACALQIPPAAEPSNPSAAYCQSALLSPGRSSHIHWAQEKPASSVQASNAKRNQSVRPSAAAIASAGLPSACSPAAGAGSSKDKQERRLSSSVAADPAYEPTYEDIQRCVKVGYGEEGVEAFIQRRLQQAALEDAAAASKKTVPKTAAPQHYMKAMLAKHRRQMQA